MTGTAAARRCDRIRRSSVPGRGLRCFVNRRETRQHSRSSSNGGSESKKAVSIVNPVLYVIVHLVDDVADNGGQVGAAR